MMSQIKKYFFLYTLLILTSIEFLYSQSNPIPKKTSDISFTLSIPLASMQNAINDNLPTVLLNDTSFTDNENDDMKTKITKGGTIKLSKFNQHLIGVDIPLNVWVEKRIGTMGFYTSQQFDFKMNMYCTIEGEIDDSGNLKTKTTIREFRFKEEPTINIAGVDFSITSMVKSELEEGKKLYAQSIDDNIEKNIPLKEMLLDLLKYFSKPFKASDEYDAWIDYECQKMQYSPFEINNNNLETQVNLVSYLKIYMRKEPMNVAQVKYLPLIEKKYGIPRQSKIYSSISIPKAQATSQANESMSGEVYKFKDDQYSIKIDSVSIDTRENDLQINLNTSMDFDGTISLNGEPYYDTQKQEIYLMNPIFKAKSRNKLYQVALWLKKGNIQRQIAEKYGFPVGENLQIIQQGIDDYLNTSYYDSIFLSGKTQDFDIHNIRITPYGIVIYYYLTYDLKVELKSLKGF